MSTPVIIDTMPPFFKLICPYGDDRVFNLAATYKDANGAIQPFPLTNDSITLLVKNSRIDADNLALITATVGSGLAITNGPGGLFTWTLLGSQTAGIFTTFLRGIPYPWAAKVMTVHESVAW